MIITMECKLNDAKRPISVRPAPQSKLVLMAIVLLTHWAVLSNRNVLVDCVSSPSPGTSSLRNATNPLIYKRLRFDVNFMQIYRRQQKYLAADEHKESIKVNESLWNGAKNKFETKEVELEYYQNDQVEATNFTYDDLVFEALDRAYLSRLTPAFVYNYDNKEDMLRASDPSLVSPSKCEKDLTFLMEQLYEIERARVIPSKDGVRLSNAINAELLGFFDAFANEEPGLLLGHYHWTGGNWLECSKRLVFNVDRTNASNSVEFKGRYCLASLRSPNWDAKVVQRTRELIEIDHFKYPGQEYNYKRFHRVQVGICLPESCHSQVLSARPDDIHKLATFKLSQPLRSYNLVDLYCLPDESSELRQLEPAGKLFMFCSIVWLSLIVLATYIDYKHSAASSAKAAKPAAPASGATSQPRPQLTLGQKLVSSFSLIRNFERLVETKSCQPAPPLSSRFDYLLKSEPSGAEPVTSGGPPNGSHKLVPNDLLFLNSIKVLGMTVVIFGHVAMQLKQLDRFVLNFDCQSKFMTHLHFSAVFYVDLFFVISSFLMAYIVFVTNKAARNSITDWLYSVVHRYWRLAPIYFILVWFCQSLFMHTGSGPLWDYGSNNMTLRSICRRESFWYPLTLTANFHPIHQECVMPSWYISSDMQFYLVVPILLVVLHKSALLGWLVTCGAIVASISLRLHRYLTDEHAQPLELMRPRSDLYMRNNWDMHETYLLPQYRIAAYLIGLLAGHYTYMVLSGKWNSPLYFNPATWNAGPPESTLRKGHFKQALRSTAAKRLVVTLVGILLMCMMVNATLLISELFPVALEPHVKYFTAVIYAFDHATAGLAAALCLTTLMLGQWEPLKQFMSHPAWSVLSRINYLLLLVQVEVINWVIQSSDRPIEFNNLEMFKILCHVSVILYPLCTIIALVLEQPLIQLERNFIAPIFRLLSSSSSGASAKQAPAGDASVERSRRSGHDLVAGKAQRHQQSSEMAQLNSDETKKLCSNK